MSNRISVMVISGSRERLQMSAMVASVGAVSGNEVHVFLSMNALTYFVKSAAKEPPVEGPVGTLLGQKKVPPFRELLPTQSTLATRRFILVRWRWTCWRWSRRIWKTSSASRWA